MAVCKLLPSQAYLQECLAYDAETGALKWRHRPRSHFVSDYAYKTWNTRWANKMAGNIVIKPNGYLSYEIKLDYVKYIVARVVYKFVHNEEHPLIDHIDTDTLNSRISNLRPCTHQTNKMNTKLRKDNKYGLKGVSFCSFTGRYAACIKVDRKTVHLGRFDTPERAHEAYREAAIKYFGSFARFG